MSFRKTNDVFIAYHGSYESGGSKQYADKVYEYLTGKGVSCFYFPCAKTDTYKANIIEVMRSRSFLFVCAPGIHRLENGKINSKSHYELSTEIDAFYALTQIDEAAVADARVLACGEWRKGDEAELHELFANRTHLYESDGDALEKVYEWVTERTSRKKTWQETQITSEIKEVFATRAAMNRSCRFDDLVATASNVRAVGISNSELTARINPGAIVNCVEHGGKIEILFLDPEGKYTKLREEEEKQRPNRIKNITNVNIETALDIRDDHLGGKKDNFKLYTYDRQPRMNMIFVDDYLILQYYANNVPGIDNPSFFIERQKVSPVYEFCEKVYDYLKSEAKELEL